MLDICRIYADRIEGGDARCSTISPGEKPTRAECSSHIPVGKIVHAETELSPHEMASGVARVKDAGDSVNARHCPAVTPARSLKVSFHTNCQSAIQPAARFPHTIYSPISRTRRFRPHRSLYLSRTSIRMTYFRTLVAQGVAFDAKPQGAPWATSRSHIHRIVRMLWGGGSTGSGLAFHSIDRRCRVVCLNSSAQ